MAVNAKNWQELKKPNALERKAAGDARRKAVFVASRWAAGALLYPPYGPRFDRVMALMRRFL